MLYMNCHSKVSNNSPIIIMSIPPTSLICTAITQCQLITNKELSVLIRGRVGNAGFYEKMKERMKRRYREKHL